MKHRVVLASLLAVLAFSSIPAVATPPEMGPYMQPVNVVIAAMTQHGSKGLMGAYTSDAVIIDDQAPYRWSGNDAASDWLSSLTTYGKLRYAHFTAFGDPMQVVHGPDSAYVTVLGKLRGLGARSGLQQNVLLTFTLRRVEGTWKIDSQSWTTVPPSFKWSLK